MQLPETLDNLAGVVGSVDGDRVDALMRAMQTEGLIEQLSEHRVRLTMAAWTRLDQSPAKTPIVDLSTLGGHDTAAEAAFPIDEIIQAHCPSCGPRRKAYLLRRYVGGPDYGDENDSGDEDTIDDYRILAGAVTRSMCSA